MVVDDKRLSNMLEMAYKKLIINTAKRKNIKQFVKRCSIITQTLNVDGSIIDHMLDTEMSDERRQMIYDKLLIDQDSLD